MPISQLVGLQMNLQKKLNLLAMFSVGAFATVTSIVRLKFLVSFDNSTDPTWDHVVPTVWSLIEINIAMICACLPALRALLSRSLPSLFDISHKGSRTLDSTTTTRATAKWNHDRTVMNKAQYSGDVSINTKGDGVGAVEYEMHGIMRKIDVDIVRGDIETPSIHVEDVDGSNSFTRQPSSDTMGPDDRGSEDSLFITDMPRRMRVLPP